jgi:outer membrane protein
MMWKTLSGGRLRAAGGLAPAIAAFFVLVPGSAFGQELRIAYLTSWRIIGPEAEFQGSRDAEQALNRDVDGWNRELEERKQEIVNLEREIEQKRLVVSESKRQELEQQRSQKTGEYERRAKEIYGDGGLIEKRNLELTKSILDKVKEAVTIIAREDGYDFVFDASDANLVWANKDYDITDRVLAKLAEGVTATPGATTQPILPTQPPTQPPRIEPPRAGEGE